MANPVTDLLTLLSTNSLCLLGAMGFAVLVILLIVIIYIKRVHDEQSWAHNPDKSFKLRWRRG